MSPRHRADSSRQPALDPPGPPAVQAHTTHSACTPDPSAGKESATVTAGLEADSPLIPVVQLEGERENASSGDNRSDTKTKETPIAAAEEEARHSTEAP